MANVKVRMSLSVYDNIGGKSQFLLHALVPDTTTLAAANTYLGTLATELATVSSAGVTEGVLGIVNTAIAAVPAADAEINSAANFGFLTAGAPNRYGVFVPSLLDSLIGSGGHIDVTAGPAGAFADFIVTGPLTGNYTNLAYTAFTAKKDAFRSGRKLRKRIR